ncbi:MAG: redoxin domain-containing protein [Bacteroidota bacterium]
MVQPGDILPDFELPDHTDTPRTLSLLQGDDPMVLTLHRGIYCPKDRQQLHNLVRFYPEMQVGFTRLVSITTDNSLVLLNDLRLGVGAHWPFMYDKDRVVADALDIHEYTDPHNKPQIPHTIVLKPGLEVAKVYNGYWYLGRPTTAELHADLREISREIRPDWRIDTDAMRQKWEARDKGSFYPYGASMREVFVRMAGEVDQFERD